MNTVEISKAIRAERLRQIQEEGYTLEKDDTYTKGELYFGAISYITRYSEVWPWGKETFKLSTNHIKNLIKAGALLLAELERLSREEEEGKQDADGGIFADADRCEELLESVVMHIYCFQEIPVLNGEDK